MTTVRDVERTQLFLSGARSKRRQSLFALLRRRELWAVIGWNSQPDDWTRSLFPMIAFTDGMPTQISRRSLRDAYRMASAATSG